MMNEEAVEMLKSMKKYFLPTSPLLDERIEITAIDVAIEALEKQIPMSMTEELDISGRPIRVCGNCGDAPGSGEFCRWCGQRIKR